MERDPSRSWSIRLREASRLEGSHPGGRRQSAMYILERTPGLCRQMWAGLVRTEQGGLKRGSLSQ